MSWKRLDNPKPNASSLPRNSIRVLSRAAMRDSRYIILKIGADLANRASFRQEQVQCHVMVGSGDEAGKVAVTVDATNGPFVAKRKKCGRYEISIREIAAQGRFNLTFPMFTREGAIVPMAGSPPVIVFDAGPDFLVRA